MGRAPDARAWEARSESSKSIFDPIPSLCVGCNAFSQNPDLTLCWEGGGGGQRGRSLSQWKHFFLRVPFLKQ